MYPKSTLLGLSVLAGALATPIESYDYNQDGNQGLRIPMKKKDLGVPYNKRATQAQVNNRWWVTFGVGTPPQDLNFLPDTGAAAFTVQSTLMPQNQTGDAPLYDPSQSSTANSQAYAAYTCQDFGFSGPVYTETITVGTQSFANIPLCVWNHAPQAEYGDRTGNLGMGPGGVFGNPDITIFMRQISNRIPKDVATYTFNPYLETGELDIGFVDTAKYTGTLAWGASLQHDYWYIQVDAVVDPSTNQRVSTSTAAAFRALLDHGGGGMTLRRDYLDWYFSRVPGSVWDTNDQIYHYPCNATLPDMVFATGGINLHLPKWSWQGGPISGSSTCKPYITLVNPNTPDSVYFGDAFLEGVFAAFNYTDLSIGLANRPAYSTNVPSLSVAGYTIFCTKPNFGGTCSTINWQSNTCQTLANTTSYHAVGAFIPSKGYCTMYSDASCTSPISALSAVRSPGSSDTGSAASTIGSFSCFYPSDYQPRKSSFVQFCTQRGFTGSCIAIGWKSFECHNLSGIFVNKNFLSAGPNNGYCYLFTNQGCTGALEDGAPFVYPGRVDVESGNKVQSFMCV